MTLTALVQKLSHQPEKWEPLLEVLHGFLDESPEAGDYLVERKHVDPDHEACCSDKIETANLDHEQKVVTLLIERGPHS